ncbi:hypothetical protein AB6A40_002702 [Gnathostoma spinigerum]|uniref:B box-type domain-containing protein n=1 Tax=Gnathostoma spinigerum TaxID=75299 RepID=A0ABD6E7G6_9BILA
MESGVAAKPVDGNIITSAKFSISDEQLDSPPSLNGDKKSVENAEIKSGSSSPLLDTAPLPSDDDSMCPYCGRHFRKPRVLDCLHSMCEDCIIAQLDGRNDGETVKPGSTSGIATDCELEQNSYQLRPTPPGVIRCPICHQESHVGNDVRFVNHLLLDFVRLHEADSACATNGTRTCRACKSEQLAVAVCKQCASDLCKNCVQAHHDMRLFDGHTVLMYSELLLTPSELPREPVMCIMHPSVPYALLCTSCETLICAQCHSDHSDTRHHNLVNVDDRIASVIMNELRELANQANAKTRTAQNACNCIPERQRTLSSEYDLSCSQIEEAFSEYQRRLLEEKERILGELDKIRDEQETQLNNLSHRINITTVKINDAISFTNRLLERATPMEILASRKKIRQQLTTLMHSIPDLNSTIGLSFVRPTSSQFALQLSNIVGSVRCRVVSDFVKNDAVEVGTAIIDSELPKKLASLRASSSGADVTPSHSVGSSTSSRTTPTRPESVNQHSNSAFSVYNASGPGTIGMERRHKSSTLGSRSSTMNDFNDGWPPSSVPPEPPSPSPPRDFSTHSATGVGSNQSFYNWPPSSNPPPEPRTQNNSNLSALPQAAPGNHSIPLLSSLCSSGNVASLLGVQKPSNLWMATAAASVANQLSAGSYGVSTRQRMPVKIADPSSAPFMDPAVLHMALQSLASGIIDPSLAGMPSFPQIPPALGRQSQCGAPPTDHLLSGGIIGDRSFALGVRNSLRVSAPKNNASAADLTLRWHTGGMGSGAEQFSSPHGFCLGLDDEILIADTNNHRIQILSKSGKMMGQFGIPGAEDGHLFYPKKIVAVRPRPGVTDGGYVIVDKGDNKARLQVFSKSGEFLRKIVAPYIDYVSAITTNEIGHVVVFSSTSFMFVFDIDQGRDWKVLKWWDCSKFLEEPSDVSVFEGLYYVTDYKNHCVVVINIEGEMLRRFGCFEQTPYPIGIDVSKAGDVLVGDSHGNHFHILATTKTGHRMQDFECTQVKVSRCVGLRITTEGYLVTISKHNHNVLLYNTLYLSH